MIAVLQVLTLLTLTNSPIVDTKNAAMDTQGTSIANLETIRKTVAASFPQTPIRAVSPSPITGIYEVQTANNLLYTDESGKYLFVGGIYDPATNTDLIKARKTELGMVDTPTQEAASTQSPPQRPASFVKTEALAEVDKFAITTQYVEGAPVVYEVFDPMCGACRKNDEGLEKTQLTIKRLLLVTAGSQEINEQVYCSTDPAAAIKSLLSSNTIVTDGTSRANCNVNDLASIKQWLRNNGVPLSTPHTIIAKTGQIVSGAQSVQRWADIEKAITN
ncbi:disulfide isomerase DsbC N-terminal domain-containing protein [Enterovibrio paralichthyis]|uniref:disulfide isomerase DsbC N-terminal domain-containing protein n=1 Tax=Enterovibrio paralichthyis TaxID=2853805 RepID=UPI001C471978|nr:disulfide isomerase DsbC N-terminal domain-containing protein [Enterovibrio paralichthyis]MBV7300270.1 hypothetical protein [Enterovibrio paralichthyis]